MKSFLSGQKLYQKVIIFIRKYNISKKAPLVLGFLALLSGFATYLAITYEANLEEKTKIILPLVYLDSILLLLLLIFVGRKFAELWVQQKRKRAGAKLHVHLVGFFGFIALVPAICMGLFSALFFNAGVEAWFSKPVRHAINKAHGIAESYLKEHQKAIIIDAQALVSRLRPRVRRLLDDRKAFERLLNEQADERNLGEVLVFDGNSKVLARSYLAFSLEIAKVAFVDLHKARSEEVVVRDEGDRVRALARLDDETDTYILVGKIVAPDVLENINQTENALKDYRRLSEQRSGVQLTFLVLFSLVALLLLLGAMGIGLTIANVLIRPIGRLITAAECVSKGDLTVQIEDISPLHNELDQLIDSFNRMVFQLKEQKENLILTEKKAAWADVARKIAHEIKNPLTPIQLSAERLKKRYVEQISVDQETFLKCIDIIIRQSLQIGNLVNEFSSFARMPEAKFEKVNLSELCSQVYFLQQQAYSFIKFDYSCPPDPIFFLCDPQQVNQVFVNLIQNSINAITEAGFKKGIINFTLQRDREKIEIRIEDNGPGFPEKDRNKLLDPYYTTRVKGTGLGLAIVSKIVSDHKGTLELRDSSLGGGLVILNFYTTK